PCSPSPLVCASATGAPAGPRIISASRGPAKTAPAPPPATAPTSSTMARIIFFPPRFGAASFSFSSAMTPRRKSADSWPLAKARAIPAAARPWQIYLSTAVEVTYENSWRVGSGGLRQEKRQGLPGAVGRFFRGIFRDVGRRQVGKERGQRGKSICPAALPASTIRRLALGAVHVTTA